MIDDKSKTEISKIIPRMIDDCDKLFRVIVKNKLEEALIDDISQLVASVKKIAIGFMQTDEIEELLKGVTIKTNEKDSLF